MDDKTIQDTLLNLAKETEETNTDISSIIYTIVGSMYVPEYMEKLHSLCREFCLTYKKDAEQKLTDMKNKMILH